MVESLCPSQVLNYKPRLHCAVCLWPMTQTWRLTSTKTTRLIRDGEKGRGGGEERVWRWGKREIIYIATLSPQNDCCIKMGSDVSNCDGQSHKTASTDHIF